MHNEVDERGWRRRRRLRTRDNDIEMGRSLGLDLCLLAARHSGHKADKIYSDQDEFLLGGDAYLRLHWIAFSKLFE